MAEIDQVQIELLFPGSPWAWKERLLAAFEAQPTFAPSHWGESDSLRHDYVREDLTRFVDEARMTESPPVPSLRRVVQPRYVATWSTSERSPGWVVLKSQMRLRPEDPALLFDFAQTLAEALPVEYGLVDIGFEGVPADLAMNRGALQHPRAYLEDGPDTLFARTFLGPRLVALMGGEPVLRASGGVVKAGANGVVTLDLLDAPWKAEPGVLKQRQLEVLEKLRPTGIFSRQEGLFPRPGERWKPPPSEQPA
ncbi:hypothetical protein HPC49_27430 [Pyxidicoccus fallax]|uniref:Immunity protein 52 domain-containing protein n=1 Tax=Pyxidicoccus fallax TaxID=394095 RepID=A0A848LPA7_9BACT|nr:hypothetical protein [Pyxidicoccus fallax]NMO19482.1 hypothetical protein [Pyxidicoccus fallax]NPC81938.1 hypothetical protein [Pyxidicoccus fallax]